MYQLMLLLMLHSVLRRHYNQRHTTTATDGIGSSRRIWFLTGKTGKGPSSDKMTER
jgi:hypothetical protein